MFTFVILGLASGAVYGMSGVGLVLTYRTSNVFNFAYGAIGTVSAYIFYSLHVNDGMVWPLAALIAIASVGIIGGVLFSALARAISTAPLTLQVASTVGVMLIVEGACTVIYGTNALNFPSFLSTKPIMFLGATVGEDQIIVFIVASVLTAALWFVLRRSRFGLSMRAVVEAPTLLSLSGKSPTRIRAFAWMIGTSFAAVAGVLIAPSTTLNPEILTLLVVQAYAAAALGVFKSIPLTFVGGLVVGVVTSVCTYYATKSAFVGDITPGMPFLLLLIVLVAVPRGRLPKPRLVAEPGRKRPSLRTHAVIGIPLLVALALVPQFAEDKITTYAGALAVVILFMSLGLLVRESGQVSLAHLGFAAVGAAAFAHLAGHGVPWALALGLAGLFAVPCGALLAIPAVRHGGIYLALATFGFGLVLADTFYTKTFVFGLAGNGISVALPDGGLLVSDSNYYLYLALAFAVAVLLTLLLTGRLGRLLNAFGQSPIALVTLGLNTTTLQVSVFCLSAFVAGVAGALFGATLGIVNGVSFDPIVSLTYVTLIVISVGGAPWYAWGAGLFVTLLPAYVSGENTPNYLNILFGLSAVTAAVLPSVLGNSTVQRRVAAVTRRVPATRQTAGNEGSADAFSTEQRIPVEPGESAIYRNPPLPEGVEDVLQIKNLSVRFGGLIAVDGLNLRVRPGAITALIGPNGAGKTTTFNAVSGLNHIHAGSVILKGQEVTTVGAAARARLGMSRTFQEMQLFDGLSVFENIAVVSDAQDAGATPWRQMLSRRTARREAETQVRRIAQRCGLTEFLAKPAGVLSTAQRRLVDLARALNASPDLLLLDEPVSGLDVKEGEALMTLLRRLCDEQGTAILVVEHDMDFILKMADYVYVLDFGKLVFEGSVAEVMASQIVRDAYIGDVSSDILEETI